MMKIKSVYIDGLHTVHDKIYTFGDITYLHGRNGAGKSTILNAIQFALLGYIPGTSKTKAAILRHSKDNKIVVKIVLDDNGQEIKIDRILTENLNTVNITPEGYDIASVTAELELPIFNFNEFVGQTANKLKDYFIQNILPINNGTIDWDTVLKEPIKDIKCDNKNDIIQEKLATLAGLSGDSLSQTVQANQIFKDEQSACNAELKSLQGAIDSLIFYDDYTGPTNIEQIDAQIKELSTLKDNVIAYKSAEMQVERVAEQIADAIKEQETLRQFGDLDAFQHVAKSTSEQCEDYANKMQDIKDEMHEIDTKINARKFVVNGKGHCQYTGSICKDMLANAEKFAIEIKELSDKKAQLQEQLDRYQGSFDMSQRDFAAAQCQIDRWNKVNSRLDNLQSVVSVMPAKPATDKSDIELAEEIKVLQDNKMKAFANQKYNSTIDELTKKKFDLELELAIYKAWVKATDVNGLQTEIMKQPFNELADKMTQYIQTMYGNDSLKAHFNVEAKANSFTFGLIRDNKYIQYDLLSSGEKCLYTLALMICIIDNSKSPLKVVLLDDALDNLDDVAIENTFTALKNITNIQFLLAGVKHSNNAADVVVEVS